MKINTKHYIDEMMEMVTGLDDTEKWKAFTASPMPMMIISYPEGLIFEVNDSFEAFVQYARREAIGYTDLELGLWANLGERKKVINRINKLRKVRNMEVSIRQKTDTISIVLFSSEQVIISNKPYLMAWFVDISDKKHLQEELREQKQEIKTLLENFPDIVARIDKDFRYKYISPAIEMQTGIPSAKFIGRTLSELGFDAEFCNRWKSQVGQVFSTGKKLAFERCLQGVQEGQYYYQVYLAPEYEPDGSVGHVLSHIRNITSVKETENALRKSEENKQRILEAFPDLMFLINKSGVFLDYQASRRSLLYTSPDLFMGKTVSEVMPDQVAEKIMQHIEYAIDKGQMQIFDYQLIIEGNVMSFEARIVCASKTDEVLFIVRDITKLKQMESSLARFDRLNTIGEMAAGIAHELRNPMTTVRGFLQVLGNKPETSCFKKQFGLMMDELDRANSIITEYLSFAKDKTIKLEYNNLSTIIESLAPLIKADATVSNKSLELLLLDTPDILIDPKEIRQLLLNLARNGLEAMQPGTTLTIKTYQENHEVVLVVQDQGSGIKRDVLEKLGTPFFTTKDNGNGLGLSICYTIAAHHGAVISVDTTSSGTSFLVRFKISK